MKIVNHILLKLNNVNAKYVTHTCYTMLYKYFQTRLVFWLNTLSHYFVSKKKTLKTSKNTSRVIINLFIVPRIILLVNIFLYFLRTASDLSFNVPGVCL